MAAEKTSADTALTGSTAWGRRTRCSIGGGCRLPTLAQVRAQADRVALALMERGGDGRLDPVDRGRS